MKLYYARMKPALAAATTALLFLCSGAALHAEEETLYYTLTAIEDVSYGEAVVAGDYETAIEGILTLAKVARGGFEAQTNLCVAYTRSGDFEKADDSCDAALAALKRQSRNATAPGLAPFYSRRLHEKYLALALSNRGVLRVISGEPDLAREDFEKAANLKFGLDVADANLAKLGTEES
ncbi:MAG: hypothetical protein R3288_13465 [Woeseiaceae bacterium]|nr:hypothetical protein [Woeseiaceae bacterium]